jgi:hypothetical protein
MRCADRFEAVPVAEAELVLGSWFLVAGCSFNLARHMRM